MVVSSDKMAEVELLDYEDEAEVGAEEAHVEDVEIANGEAKKPAAKPTQGYVSIHSSGFKDFLLKPELLKAIFDAGFEHPSGKFQLMAR